MYKDLGTKRLKDRERYWAHREKIRSIQNARYRLLHPKPPEAVITPRQFEIIKGSLLGDGCLTKCENRRQSMYCEGHCIKQRGYAMWKFEELKPLSSYWQEVEDKGGFKKGSKFVQFTTKVHTTFTAWERNWYMRDVEGKYILCKGRRIKIVPLDLDLSPLAVAVWYFDDGCLLLRKRMVEISTNSFTVEECDRLVQLLNRLGIAHVKVRLKKRGRDKRANNQNNKTEPIIEVSPYSFVDFIDMVKPHLACECMAYKVDMSNYIAPHMRWSSGDLSR